MIALRLPFYGELSLQQSLLEILTGLGGLAVVVAGAFVAGQGGIDPALLPLLAILAMAAFLPVSEIAQVGRQLADTLGATRRIYGLAHEPVVVSDGPGVAPRPGPAALGLSDVSFTYPGQNRPALSTSQLPDSRRQDRGAGRHLGRGQDHDGTAADALLGSRSGCPHPQRL